MKSLSYLRFPMRMILFALIYFLASVIPVFAQHAPDDWDRFRFEGNRTFKAEQLRAALVAEPDFLLANHPRSNNADVHEVTKTLLVSGYKRAGFQSPSVQIETAENGVTLIRIDEGLRQRCGAIRVEGAMHVNKAALVELLTQPKVDSQAFPLLADAGGLETARWVNAQGTAVLPDPPVWQTGKPVPWTTEKQIEQSIKTAFESLGFRATDFRVAIESTPNVPHVDLVIEIVNEGEQDKIQTFKVTGTTANTPAQVLDFLGLQPGGVFDIYLQHKLNQRLYDCGRFRTQLVKFERSSAGEGCLCIELTDVPGVPSLAQPLRKEAEVLLLARRWLSEYEQRGDDLVFLWETDQAKLTVVQSRQGTFLQIDAPTNEIIEESETDAQLLKENPPAKRTSLLIDSQRVSVSHSRGTEMWMADVSGFEGVIRLETSLSAAESDTSFGTVNFNVTWKSQRLAEEPLLRQTLRLTPAGWCAFAYKKNANMETRDGKLILTHGTQTLEVDVETGRIDRFESGGSNVYQQAGAFDRLRNTHLIECAERKNLFDSLRPITSLIQFCVSESGQMTVDDIQRSMKPESFSVEESLFSAIKKLALADLFLPLDAFAIHGREWARTERFAIPDQTPPPGNLTAMAIKLVGKYVLSFLPDLFAEGTWPMKVTREACLVTLDRGRYTGAVLQELSQDPTAGPLRCAAIAYLLSLANQPLAKSFANRAITTMEPIAFDKDQQVLLSGRCGKWVAGVLQGVGTLSEQEIESIKSMTKSEAAKLFLQSLHSSLKVDDGNQSLWYQVTHKAIESKMREILGR